MKYSIIIPVYNAKKFLNSCIQSIFDSGLRDFEVILVNDGSTDDSDQECIRLSQKHPEIVYINQNNRGVSAARNTGIKHSKGEYILFCDADDFFEKNCFVDLNECLSLKPDLLVYGLSMDFYYKNICYQQNVLIYPMEGAMDVQGWSAIFKRLYDFNVLSPVWNKVYRRDVIQKYGVKFNEKMMLLEDLVFSVEYFSYCSNVFFYNNLAYHYKQSEDEHRIQKRLNIIDSLNNYVKEIQNIFLNADFNLFQNKGLRIIGIEEIIGTIFYTLVSQKLYYASLREIKMYATEILRSDFCSEALNVKVGNDAVRLYRNLQKKRYLSIRLHNKYHQIRHAIAIRYKYLKVRYKDNIYR